jgi:hypothetical protein
VQQDLKVPQAELRACLWNFGTFDRSAIKRNARASHISRINLNEYTLGSNCRSKVCIRAKKKLAGRLLLQFMKLARSKFNQRFKSSVAKLAETVSQKPAA